MTEGRVTTVAGQGGRGMRDGAGASATFHSPWGLDVSPDGTVYVADCGNHALRRVGRDGRVSTIAGSGERGYVNGRRQQARFFLPRDVAVGKLRALGAGAKLARKAL